MQVQTPSGPMIVQVPADKKPGDMFTFGVPAPQQAPQQAVAQVMQPQMAPQQVVQPVQGYPATGQQVMMVQPVMAMAPVQHRPYFSRVSTMATCIGVSKVALLVAPQLGSPAS